MPQPVQPPEIPAIIQPVTYEDAANLDRSAIKTTEDGLTRSLPTGAIPTQTSPEAFLPESSLKADKRAALLGSPISIGYSLQPLTSSTEEVRPARERSDRPRTLAGPTNPASSNETRSTSQVSPTPTPTDAVTTVRSPAASEVLIPNSSPIRLGTQNIKRLITQERGGEVREFEFSVPGAQPQSSPDQNVTPTPAQDEATPQTTPSPTPGTAAPTTLPPIQGVIELTADRQEYDEQRQVITAQGNVVLRFQNALVNADRVQINLPNRLIVADGNVSLTRGQQVLRGQRFEYYFVQDSGVILNASGELYTPTAGTDLSFVPGQGTTGSPLQRPLSDRISIDQPLQGISNPGGYSFVIGAGSGRTAQNVSLPPAGGTINRFRYQAERVDFEGSNAIARNVRITNDPFSPPELELRADTARFTRLEPLVDEIVATRPRIVFDQGLEVPTFRNRITIDRRPREPALFNIGYDGEDRGGLFIERSFNVFTTPNLNFRITPQYFIQKAFFDEGVIDPSVFGLRARLDGEFSPRTTLRGRAVLTSLDPSDFGNELRASLRLQQVIGTTLPHALNLEYSYRDRLFNGSLGFQTVRSSIGAVISSPIIPLGNTGINLFYQAGAQYITADTDRLDLLQPVRENNRISLGRYQGVVTLSRGFPIWQGQPLPATPTEGLRYAPTPVVPYLSAYASLTGVGSAYSNGDTQESLSGTVGIVGQLGHFSRPYLDYTGFSLSYTQVALGNQSPFLFDRIADTKVLSAGVTQQVYGPFRIGVQTSINVDTGEEISTEFLLEYSRRTYNILLRFNPVQELGSISLRINDFNWTGNPGLFDGFEPRPVRQGVIQSE